MNESPTIQEVRQLVGETLGLSCDQFTLADEAPLLGAVPEIDSMAVVAILTALEQRFGIAVEDDEIQAELFASLFALTRFVERKLPGKSTAR